MFDRERQSSRTDAARRLVIAGGTFGALGVAGAIGVGIHASTPSDAPSTDSGSSQDQQQNTPTTGDDRGENEGDDGGTLVRPSRPRPAQNNNLAPSNTGASNGGGSHASSSGS